MYLINYWFDVGLAEQGPAPLSSIELIGWQKGTKISLSVWEFRTLRNMSRSYVSSLLNGTDENSQSPYGDSNAQIERDKADAELRASLKSLVIKNK